MAHDLGPSIHQRDVSHHHALLWSREATICQRCAILCKQSSLRQYLSPFASIPPDCSYVNLELAL